MANNQVKQILLQRDLKQAVISVQKNQFNDFYSSINQFIDNVFNDVDGLDTLTELRLQDELRLFLISEFMNYYIYGSLNQQRLIQVPSLNLSQLTSDLEFLLSKNDYIHFKQAPPSDYYDRFDLFYRYTIFYPIDRSQGFFQFKEPISKFVSNRYFSFVNHNQRYDDYQQLLILLHSFLSSFDNSGSYFNLYIMFEPVLSRDSITDSFM